jgi:hypothetical protein
MIARGGRARQAGPRGPGERPWIPTADTRCCAVRWGWATSFATIDPDLALCDPELRQLAGLVQAVRFRAGDVIIREGDAGDSLFIVGSGKVRIVRLADGNEIPVAELRRGALFGELAVLEGRTRTATVIADEDAELLRLDRSLMKQLLAQRDPLSYKIRWPSPHERPGPAAGSRAGPARADMLEASSQRTSN